MRSIGLLAGCLLLVSVTGCQCCRLTDHYACLIDYTSDHEHHCERFYSPGWDLNRIGRPDWCSYLKNRVFCRCACNRCKPAACGYIVSTVGPVVSSEQVSHPDWSAAEDATDEPSQSEDAAHDVPVPPALESIEGAESEPPNTSQSHCGDL